MNAKYPERIVCLSTETTEVLYLLEEQDRIVGISGYTVRPSQARREKPKISAFTSAKIDKIVDLKPDLVLGFSDLQAPIALDLIKRGVEVHIFNQRSVQGILGMILSLGSLVGAHRKAQNLIQTLTVNIEKVKKQARKLSRHPRVYFEEWYDPLIAGVQWVSELIEIAGGIDCFPELAAEPSATNRIIKDPGDVVSKQPDIIIGSWCGKKFQPDVVCQRSEWSKIPAVRNGHVYEIKSANILQPGPAAVTDGLSQLHEIIVKWGGTQI
jgi:iron complex transport system substrate-binding protein